MSWLSRAGAVVQRRTLPGVVALIVGGVISAAAFLWILDRTHAAEVITAIAHLTWPLSVALIAYWYREDVKLLLSRLLEAKFPGGEVKFHQSMDIPPPPQILARKRSVTEYRILKTLWTKQVNMFPHYEGVWTFRVNSVSSEYLEFREAGGKLIGERLVDEDTNGQLYLTRAGFKYCTEHYQEFPEIEEWYPHETLKPEQLQKALSFNATARITLATGVAGTTATHSSSSMQKHITG
jgi:hypothetical protein